MPHDVAENAEAAGRYTLFFTNALVLALVVALMRSYLILPADVGMRAEHWKSYLLAGVLGGIILRLFAALLQSIGDPKAILAASPFLKGSPSLWLGIIVAGTFAEELWRAFCLVELTHAGHPAYVGVFLTAMACGVPQLRFSNGRAIGRATFGLFVALLFVWQGSLLTTFTASLTASVGSFSWARRTKRKLDSGELEALSRRLRCPSCGSRFGYEQHRSAGWFACPACNEFLEISPSYTRWVGFCSLVISGSVAAALGLRWIVLLLATEILWIPILVVVGILARQIVPPKLVKYGSRGFTLF